jgi:hypothetical protein
MNERENELARASAENGAFDPAKAKKLTTDTVSHYHSRLKWAGRLTWACLILEVAVMVFAFNAFLAASTTKAIVGFGILLLVAYETTILMKLWYWIVNTKVTLLKELKQLKLQFALSSAAVSLPADDETSSRRLGTSRAEHLAWCVALIAASIAVSCCRPLGETSSITPMTIDECITLKADGGAKSLTKISEPIWPVIGSFHYTFGEPEKVRSVRWLDHRGRELPYDTSIENKQRNYTIHLIEPVTAGEKLRYTQITELSSAATKKGDLWTYVGDYQYGGAENQYLISVELPRGARTVTSDPKAVSQWTDNGIEHLAFQATRAKNERFRYKVEYRLDDNAGDKKAAGSG